MLCLIKGNAQQIFSAFDCSELKELTQAANERTKNHLKTPFLGNLSSARLHHAAWQHKEALQYCTEENMSAGILKGLLGKTPLKIKNETLEHYNQQFFCNHFAYVDNTSPCALLLMSRKDKPEQWMIGLIKKTQANPRHREIQLFSSFDLINKINPKFYAEIKRTIDREDVPDNSLIPELAASIPASLFKHIFPKKKGIINEKFERIDFLLRYLNTTQKQISLYDPVDFSQLNIEQLYEDNQALDLISRYAIHRDLHLPFALLLDLLSKTSELRKLLETTPLTHNAQINKNLLQMTLVYYEEHKAKRKETEPLEEYRALLADHEFIRLFGGFMWDKAQIKLISVFYNKKKTLEQQWMHSMASKEAYFHAVTQLHQQMQFILSEEAYFHAVHQLAEMNYFQDVLTFFQNPEKVNQLEYIYKLLDSYKILDEDTRTLCWIFWIKGNLSLEGYEKIVQKTLKYPLLASTLIILDKKQTVEEGIIGLEQLAFQPTLHLKKTIKLQFFSRDKQDETQEKPYTKNLNNLSEEELEAASNSLLVLRDAGIKDRKKYHLVIDDIEQSKAKILRIFLPQIANISDLSEEPNKREQLINALYEGINELTYQGKVIKKISEEAPGTAGYDLYERFICVRHLQKLKFDEATIKWTAEENHRKAKAFRHIILGIEEQCKMIGIYLKEPKTSNAMRDGWRDCESDYRKKLYQIAFIVLKNPQHPDETTLRDTEQHIKKAEKEILDIIDPPIKSPLHKAIILLANILISVLTLGISNYIKYRQTNQPWFFIRNEAGERLCRLNQDTFALIKSAP